MSQIRKDTVQDSTVHTPAASGDCACPPPVNDNKAGRSGWLRNIFKKCAMCAGSGAGGLLAGHAGCIITPLVIAAAGATTATAGLPLIAVAFSAAVTAGGLYVWHRLRGHHAGKWEKRLVIGGALTGVLLSSAFNMSSHQHHHHHENTMPAHTEVWCGTPPSPAKTNQP